MSMIEPLNANHLKYPIRSKVFGWSNWFDPEEKLSEALNVTFDTFSTNVPLM